MNKKETAPTGQSHFLSRSHAQGLPCPATVRWTSVSLPVKWSQNTQVNRWRKDAGSKGSSNGCGCPGLQGRQETARLVFHPAFPLHRHSREPELAGGPWGPWGQCLVQMGPDSGFLGLPAVQGSPY